VISASVSPFTAPNMQRHCASSYIHLAQHRALIANIIQYSRATLEQRLVGLESVNVGCSCGCLVEHHFCETFSPRIPGGCDISWGVSVVRSLIHGHSHEGVRESGYELGIVVCRTSAEVSMKTRIGFGPSHRLTM